MRIRALTVLAALGAALGSGCSDEGGALLQPGAPLGAAAATAPGAARSASRVAVVQRRRPLEAPVAATQAIGSAGGVIALPEAGFQLVIPPNAIVPPGSFDAVEITVTALPGSNVAYGFEPHGLVFRVPVHAVQDARHTRGLRRDGSLESATAAYFPDAGLLQEGAATVSEIRPAAADVRGRRYSWEIGHFSGYLLATDRKRN